jgi:hypothetical protein
MDGGLAVPDGMTGLPPHLNLPDQRRVVDLIVCALWSNAANPLRPRYIFSDNLQFTLWHEHNALYRAAVGIGNGRWRTFLQHHGDAFRLVDWGRSSYVGLHEHM